MTPTGAGPPKKAGPARGPATVSDHHTTTDSAKRTTDARRRDAALRLPPLPPCGCIRDPLCDMHRHDPEPSGKQTEAAVLAAEHLRDAGLLPLFDPDTMRSLWKAGHHRLVETLREAS